MKKKIFWLLVSCLMALSLVLASCGPAVTEEEEEEVVTEEEEEVVTEEEEEVGEPQYGGTLTSIKELTVFDVVSLDPADRQWVVNPYVCFYLGQLLVGDLARGPLGTDEVKFVHQSGLPGAEFATGDLAESWELTGPTTLTFKIREGIYWQEVPGVMSRRELTAVDVAFSLNRYLESPYFGPLYFQSWIESIEATDKYTVVLEMLDYYGDWHFKLGYGWYTFITPPELIDAGIKDWRNHIGLGTGPFLWEDYVVGSSRTYVKNPDYWGTWTVNGKEYQLPFLDKLRLPIIKDEATAVAALRTGKADINEAVGWKYKESLAATNPELQVYELMEGDAWYIALNYANPLYQDPRVVKALNMAIDREAMIKVLLGGTGVTAYPALPRFTKIYTPIEERPKEAREMLEYNPVRARELLALAGHPDGFESEIVVYSVAARVAVIEMVAAYWEEIGVKTAISTMEYGAYDAVGFGKTFEHGWHSAKAIDTVSNQLSLFTSPLDPWNAAGWEDPWYTEFFNERIKSETDLAKKAEAMKELSVYLMQHASYVWLPLGSYSSYAWPWVKNFYGEYNVGSYDSAEIYAHYWIDQELKEEMGY